jgi:hypothetical protein
MASFVPNVRFVGTPVTKWMTAAGIALIAGGLVTLTRVRRAQVVDEPQNETVDDQAVETAEPRHVRMARAVLARSRDVHPELATALRTDAAPV